MAEDFSVDSVVQRLGVTSRTLHYYEELGLIPEVARTNGGHRMYNEATVKRIEQILELKETLGFSLKEIRRILDVESSLDQLRHTFRHGNLSKAEQLQVLDEYSRLLTEVVLQVDARMDKLQGVRQQFQDRLDRTRQLRDETEKK